MKKTFAASLALFCFQALACQLSIPEQKEFIISADEDCSFRIKNKKDYMDLSYYKTLSMSIASLFTTEEISRSDDAFYLPYEFVEDANYTIRPTNQNPLRKLERVPEIWESVSTVHVTSLPKKQFSGSKSFSLTLACLDIVGGDAHRSFVTRYCQPKNKKNLQKEFDLYIDLVEKIRVIDLSGDTSHK
jgi:hypothetical protein